MIGFEVLVYSYSELTELFGGIVLKSVSTVCRPSLQQPELL